jgi:prevent-host-death family protein
MKVINTVELKNHTNQILHQVQQGHPVAITLRGKPCAALVPLKEDQLGDIAFEYSPQLRKLIREAEEEIKAGRIVTWQEFLKHERASRLTGYPKARAGTGTQGDAMIYCTRNKYENLGEGSSPKVSSELPV